MLTELDVHGVVLGHSERRELFGETDKALAQKVPAALEPPASCRSSAWARPRRSASAGDTERKLRHQVQEGLAGVPTRALGEVVIAYEPIWAIGTGRVATPEQAQEAIAFVRALRRPTATREHGRAHADPLRRLVKPENAAELLALPDVDGALVGGALARRRVVRRDRRRRATGDRADSPGPEGAAGPARRA